MRANTWLFPSSQESFLYLQWTPKNRQGNIHHEQLVMDELHYRKALKTPLYLGTPTIVSFCKSQCWLRKDRSLLGMLSLEADCNVSPFTWEMGVIPLNTAAVRSSQIEDSHSPLYCVQYCPPPQMICSCSNLPNQIFFEKDVFTGLITHSKYIKYMQVLSIFASQCKTELVMNLILYIIYFCLMDIS